RSASFRSCCSTARGSSSRCDRDAHDGVAGVDLVAGLESYAARVLMAWPHVERRLATHQPRAARAAFVQQPILGTFRIEHDARVRAADGGRALIERDLVAADPAPRILRGGGTPDEHD